jgi:hypothetical protein
VLVSAIFAKNGTLTWCVFLQFAKKKRHTYLVRVSAIFANQFCLGICSSFSRHQSRPTKNVERTVSLFRPTETAAANRDDFENSPKSVFNQAVERKNSTLGNLGRQPLG